MATTTLPGVLLTGNHASRPAANTVSKGTLYSCTTHSLIYQSDGSSWSTWATLGGTATEYPWHVWVVPMITTPDATTGTWTWITQSPGSVDYHFVGPTASGTRAVFIGNSGGGSPAQNDAWAVDVVLAAGTWDAHFYVGKASSTGIITLQQDGTDMGTADTYAASAAAAKVSVTGWTVSATGKKRMNLKMATKNASSSGYLLIIDGIEFRRTA